MKTEECIPLGVYTPCVKFTVYTLCHIHLTERRTHWCTLLLVLCELLYIVQSPSRIYRVRSVCVQHTTDHINT